MQLHICTEYVENAMQETPSTTSNVQGLLRGFNLGNPHLTSYSNCTSESTTYSTGFIRIFFLFVSSPGDPICRPSPGIVIPIGLSPLWGFFSREHLRRNDARSFVFFLVFIIFLFFFHCNFCSLTRSSGLDRQDSNSAFWSRHVPSGIFTRGCKPNPQLRKDTGFDFSEHIPKEFGGFCREFLHCRS